MYRNWHEGLYQEGFEFLMKINNIERRLFKNMEI